MTASPLLVVDEQDGPNFDGPFARAQGVLATNSMTSFKSAASISEKPASGASIFTMPPKCHATLRDLGRGGHSFVLEMGHASDIIEKSRTGGNPLKRRLQ